MKTSPKHLTTRLGFIAVMALSVLPSSAMANHIHHIQRHQFVRYYGVGHPVYPVVAVALNAPRLATTTTVTPQPTSKIFAYPAIGQTQEQQARDNYECHTSATTQSGFNPGAPSVRYTHVPANQTLQTATGGTVRVAQHAERSAVAQPSVQTHKLSREEYNRATAACYQTRGYSVN